MRILNLCIMVLLASLSHTATANLFNTEKWTTKNGVRVIFYPAMEVPMLDISLSFAAGSAYDEKYYGLSALTSRMMNQGNAGKDATAIAEALADVGAQFHVENSKDMVVFNLRTLVESKALAQASEALTQIINHPDFPDEAYTREKTQQLMSIEQNQDSAEEIAQISFFQALYKQHPYAHSVNGTPQTVNALSKDQIIQFRKKYYVAKNAILVLVGAINSQQTHQLVDQITQELPEGQPAPSIPIAPQLTKMETINLSFPSSQTVIRLGQIGIDHHDPNYFPLMVGNYILGGGMLVSRLATEVREKQGLTYGIDSQFVPMEGKGPFMVSLSTQNEQAPKAMELIQTILRTYINEGPTDEEINAAKQYLTGNFSLSLSGNRPIAGVLLRMAFYNLSADFLDTYVARINAVTREQVKQAFKKQVNPDLLLQVSVGKV